VGKGRPSSQRINQSVKTGELRKAKSIKEILMRINTVSRLFLLVLGFSMANTLLSPIYAQQPAVEQTVGLPKPLAEDDVTRLRQGAAAALAGFDSLPDEVSFKSLGFSSAAELSVAQVGYPIQTAHVDLNQLATYAGQPAASLIQQGGVRVPVFVNGEVRSIVSMSYGGKVGGIGRPNMARLVTRALQAVSSASNAPIESLVVLEIPALYKIFIARSTGTQIWLTPVADTLKSGSQPGEEQKAEAVFALLRPLAESTLVLNLSQAPR
jgi:hypothetical protein